ncbi:MAG: chemotaxis protein CheC [Anaerolineae bacterium]|nr:chemotaxis protein CheC [Anaerolineae bacterium]
MDEQLIGHSKMARHSEMTWDCLTTEQGFDERLQQVMAHVAHGLSTMVNKELNYTSPSVAIRPISELGTCNSDLEAGTVGIYLRMQGALSGQAILTLSMSSAMHLVDLLMNVPLGTSTYLGLMQRSALAEIGNLTVAYFLNAVSKLTQRTDLLRPTPPAVVVDMLGAILNLILTSDVVMHDKLMIVESNFEDVEKTVRLCFWILPD